MSRIRRQQSNYHFESVGTKLLSSLENRKIFDFLGSGCFTLATGIAELLYGNIKEQKWQLIGRGVICYVRDYNRKEVSVQLVDVNNIQSSSNHWKLVISPTVTFLKKHPNLVAFFDDDGTLYGINFSDSFEAENYCSTAEKLQADRRQRLQKKESFVDTKGKEVQAEITNALLNNQKTHCALRRLIRNDYYVEPPTEEKTQIERKKSTDSHSEESPSKERPKGLLKEFSSKMDDALNTVKQSIPLHHPKLKENKSNDSKEKKKKRKKDQAEKPVIGLPTNFVHKAHCGLDAFMDDSELDETVRKVYEFVQQDINEADKEEIDMIRRAVSVYGMAKVRQSMRKINRSKLMNSDTSRSYETDASNANPSKQPLKVSSTPQNNFNSAIKNEIERRYLQNVRSSTPDESVDKESTMHKEETVSCEAVRRMKKISWFPNVSRRDRPPLPPPKPTVIYDHPFDDDIDYESENSANMTTNMRQSSESAQSVNASHSVNRPNSFGVQPLSNNRSNSRRDSYSRHQTHNALSTPFTATTSPSVPPQFPAPPPPSPSAPPPPSPSAPPPPPSQLASAAPNSSKAFHISEGRQNLLEAIRNVDKSTLRKVTHEEEDVTSNASAINSASEGDVMSAIAKMIEERRKHINVNSDDETSDTSGEDEADDDWSE